MSSDDARTDLKSQVKMFVNQFQKKCSNKTISIDILVQDYSNFKETITKRIQTNAIYRGSLQCKVNSQFCSIDLQMKLMN